jgi:hypothetical protein
MRITPGLLWVAVGAVVGGLSGCKGTLEALDLPRDMNITIKGDMSGGGDDDGGPPAMAVTFFPDVMGNIQYDIDGSSGNASCAVSGCHAGMVNHPFLVAMPASATDQMSNYTEIKAEVDNTTDPTMSTLMVTVNGGGGHTGGQVIAQGSATYNRWVAWISAGTPEGTP